jgi:hypothetical protein
MRDAIKTLWQYRAWRICVYVFVGSVIVGQFARALERLSTPNTFEPATFKLPVMLLACLRYEPHDGETLSAWDFEQAVLLDFGNLRGTVTLHSFGTTRFYSDGCRFSTPVGFAVQR